MADQRLYYPAAMVRLLIRLEDFLPPDPDEFVASEAIPFEQQIKRLKGVVATLNKKLAESRAKNDTTNLMRLSQQRKTALRKIDVLRSRDVTAKATAEQLGDPYSVSVLTVPLESSAELNTYRSLDTCSFTIPFRDAPLESQLIRSALVELYLGTVPVESFATRDRWKLTLDRRNLIFRGYVDEWNTTHDEDDAVVKVDARSLEAILIDTKLDPRASIFRVKKGGEKISVYVNRLLSTLPATSGRTTGDQLKALFVGPANKEPSISEASLLRVFQTSKSRAQAAGTVPGQPTVLPDTDPAVASGDTAPENVVGTGQPRMSPPVPEQTTAWDLIIQACFLADGLVPTYDPTFQLNGQDSGDFILIRPPQTLYSSADDGQGFKVDGGPLDQFDRQLPDPDSTRHATKKSEIRFFVWGRNIRSIQTGRKLGRIKVPAVEVTAYNADAAPELRGIKVLFPAKTPRATRLDAKGDGKQTEVVRKVVRGVRSVEQLKQIAVALYQALGRHELSVKIDTDDLSSYIDPTLPDQHNENPDVLRLRHGTPVRVLVARQVVDPDANQFTVTPLSEVFERRTEELRKFFLDQNQRFRPSLDADLQEALTNDMVDRISVAIDRARSNDIYYVKTIKHNWSSDDGWSASIELMNFIEARNVTKNMSATDKLDASLFKVTQPHAAQRTGHGRLTQSRTPVLTPTQIQERAAALHGKR